MTIKKRWRMRKILFSALFLLLSAGPASADLYQWKDEAGIIHITDSMDKVPSKYRDEVRVFKESPKENMAPEEAPAQDETVIEPDEPLPLDVPGEELYGGETLDWWSETLKEKRTEIDALQASVDSKTDFMRVFEGGRRFGQVYKAEDVDKYKSYQKEVPQELTKLKSVKEAYAGLKDRARRAGVPDGVGEP
jgi:hypothetical protein